MTADQAIRFIEGAKEPRCIFAVDADADAVYRKLLTLTHPDRFPIAERTRAEAAAQKLADFHNKISGKPVASPVVMGKWTVEAPFVKGDVADLYLVQSEKADGILKIARSADDNDLMAAEHGALVALHKAEPLNFRKYLPELLDTFEASGRRATVLSRHPGYLSLREIRAQLASGVPFRHIVWMMNRVLSVLGFVHGAGVVHGGITPDHLLYHPTSHGLILVGWCSAVIVDGSSHIRIIANDWRSHCPAEVERRRSAHPATDIFMAAKSMLFAADQVPDRFKSLFEWCTAISPSARPAFAWELQERWIELAEQEYGKPTYQKLVLPLN